MTVNELGNILLSMYETNGANKSTMVHLFGIIFADEMINANIKPTDVIRSAGIQQSYQTELNKGINLSKYVDVKKEYKNKYN